VMLFAGASSSGLWDPWEMNHSAVAHRMMTPKAVLVFDREGSGGALAKSLAGGGYTVETIAEPGSAGLERLRDLTTDRIFAAVVVDVPTMVPDATGAAPDDATVKALANAISGVASKNLSTKIILVSGNPAVKPGTLRTGILRAANSADPEDRVQGLDGQLAASTIGRGDGQVTEMVSHAVCAAGATAQFKSGGRTVFMPPLEPGLSSVFYRLFGYNEIGSRLTGILFAFFTILLVMFPARRIFGRHIVTGSMLVLATSMLFTGTARFAGAGMSDVFAISLGVVAFGRLTGENPAGSRCGAIFNWALLGLAVVICWLSGGMVTAVTFAAIVGTWALINPNVRQLPAVGLVFVLLGALALLTFIPDCAWLRQFRFTAATFDGGINLESRSFDFIIKEVGFGFFPWSVFIPITLWMAVTGDGAHKPARQLLLLWAVMPLISAMVFVRPFNQTMYLGVPALAILTAIFFAEFGDATEDAPLRTRLFGFFAAGLFIVMMHDMSKAPAPLVTFLTTDPMFSKPGQGDGGFPTNVHTPMLAKLFLGLMLLSILSVTARISNVARLVVDFMARKRSFVIVLACMIGLIVADVAIFTALKWRTLTSGRGGAGSELLRILLTGPDIAALYVMTGIVVVLHKWSSIAALLKKVIGAPKFNVLVRAFDAFETLRVQKVAFGGAVVGFALVNMFIVNPELTQNLSQKHIVDSWEKASEIDPGPLYRHGSFSTRGSEDNNFYTSGLQEIESRAEVTRLLGDKSKRTFFLLPTRQFSEINSAWRDVTGERGLPLLDDRSSRIVLATSRLAAGESDHNWLARATLTEAEFAALRDVDRESVNFEDSLELVGFSISPRELTRGNNPIMKVYYRVLRKITKSYRVFMHVDGVGSSTRIHGDHWILNLVPESEDQDDCIGCYATNHWKKGDIIVDTYELSVPIGSPSGDYDVWMGLYVPGGSRMKVKSFDETKVKNDGSDRVRIGRMTIR